MADRKELQSLIIDRVTTPVIARWFWPRTRFPRTSPECIFVIDKIPKSHYNS